MKKIIVVLLILLVGVANSFSVTIRIASLNWQNASDKSQSWKKAESVVHAIAEADYPEIIAFQEISDYVILKKLEYVLAKKQKIYDSYATKKVGIGGQAERYGFIWRSDRVTKYDQVYQMTNGLVLGASIARPPTGLKFRCLDKSFIVLSYHASWERKKRRQENKYLSKILHGIETGWFQQSFNSAPVILCGDFNDSDKRKEFDLLRKFWLPTIGAIDTTVGRKNSAYDEIWIPRDEQIAFVQYGIVRYDGWKIAPSDHYLVWCDIK